MAIRTAPHEVRFMVSEELYDLLQTVSASHGESVAETARRILHRGLQGDAVGNGSQVLAETMRYVLREELRGTRDLAFIAAFHSAAGFEAAQHALGMLLVRVAKMPVTDAEKRVEAVVASSRQQAAQILRRPVADASAQPEGLPDPTEEIEVDEPTAQFLSGGTAPLE